MKSAIVKNLIALCSSRLSPFATEKCVTFRIDMKLSLIVLSLFMCAGCTTNLYVRDVHSKPVVNADVMVIRYSLTGMPAAKTNENGMTKIPWGLPDIESITVSKDGYNGTTLFFPELENEPYIVVLTPEVFKNPVLIPQIWETPENILNIR